MTICTRLPPSPSLGNVFTQDVTSSDHVNNRIAKNRQSFYGFSSAGITYPGASPDVQACVYKCICQSTLYGLECMHNSVVQMRRLESVQGKFIMQSLGLNKRSHNTNNILRALNINTVPGPYAWGRMY